MKDGPFRRSVKALMRWKYALEVGFWRRRHGEPSFELTGSCEGCGKCCERPTIRVGRAVFYLRSFRALFAWWQRVVNGFELVGDDPETRTLSFHCTHFDPESRQCDSYASRPGMCRDYPRGLLYQTNPQLFEECGFGIVLRNRERFLESLEKRDLSPEQLEALKRKLRLDDSFEV
jgi:uncharacterized cysteine cluster protein YcgN (CxxCxxCC family)